MKRHSLKNGPRSSSEKQPQPEDERILGTTHDYDRSPLMANIEYKGPVRGDLLLLHRRGKEQREETNLGSSARTASKKKFSAGTALIVRRPSGHGYDFWHIAFVNKDLVLAVERDPDLYVGEYEEYFSKFKGLPPDSVRYLVPGCSNVHAKSRPNTSTIRS